MNCKKDENSKSGDEHRVFDPAVEKVVEISLDRLRPFENHPFKVREDDAMERLMLLTKYCDAIFASGAETEEFFYRLGIKDGLRSKSTVKSVLEMMS